MRLQPPITLFEVLLAPLLTTHKSSLLLEQWLLPKPHKQLFAHLLKGAELLGCSRDLVSGLIVGLSPLVQGLCRLKSQPSIQINNTVL